IGDDYVSQQVRAIGDSFLGSKLKLHPSVPRNEALDITANCNAVICCSLNETFGLYVAEGMLMGHIVLRNNSAGVDEQLRDGKNGYAIDHKNIKQFASKIEKILNKETSSDESLRKMGLKSQHMMKAYSQTNYVDQIEN